MIRLFSKFLFKRIFRWKLIGVMPNEIKKFVLIGAPHTSWHDFYIGVLVKGMLKGPLNFVGKKALFDSFFGFFFKLMGGVAVDRKKSNNFVEAVVNMVNKKEYFRLAMSPEGTRKKVDKWKSGFYYIAKGAGIPVVMMTFDFGRKQVAFSEPFYPTDNIALDFEYFYKFYEGVVGKFPK